MITTLDSFTPKSAHGFIVIEGVNGAGKSTVINAIAQALTEQNASYTKTFEPGDTPLGKELRRLLLNSPQIPRTAEAELFLFAADRAEHMHAVIRPALARGDILICDRFLYSTIAFQGYGRQLDPRLIEKVNELAVNELYPDLVILLDIDVTEGLRRTQKRSTDDPDSFEQEEIEFHQRIRKGFLSLAKTRSEPFLIIDAEQGAEKVASEAIAAVNKVLLARSIKGSSASQ